MTPIYRTLTQRAARGAALLALALSTAACNDFLNAENPGAIDADDVTDPRYLSLITNGVIGEFQFTHGYVAYWNGIFTDELYNRAVFFEEALIDQRDIAPENGTYAFFINGNLHRTRFLADDGAARMREFLGDSASRNLSLARVQAYGGLTYVYLAEMMCEAPIDLSAPLAPAELFARGIERFDEAIAIANAAKAHAISLTPILAADTLRADSLRNFALIGAARASLNIDDKPGAIAYAQQVAPNFQFRAFYSANSPRENDWFWNRLQAGVNAIIDNTPFAAMSTDPRVPRAPLLNAQGVQLALVPRAPSAFSAYTGTTTGGLFTQGGSIRIASSLEAQYIIAEAQGPTPATLTFVNQRRAVGQQAPAAFTGDALMAELRDQRRRDLYLDNHRLGDLRRYLAFYNINDFPQGPNPTSTTGATYQADVSCWPIPLAERNDNPNIGG